MYELNTSDEQEYKSSYNDSERLTLDKTSLTDYQKYIKGILTKILKYYINQEIYYLVIFIGLMKLIIINIYY